MTIKIFISFSKFMMIIIMLLCSYTQLKADNFFEETWTQRQYVVPTSSTEFPLNKGKVTNKITINTSNVIAKVLPTHFGANTTFRNGSDQLSRTNLYEGKITLMRYPAGSGSNLFFFDGKIPADVSTCVDKKGNVLSFDAINGNNAKTMTPQLFASFKQRTNSEAIVAVNYFYARYGKTASGLRADRVKQAAEYAAEFVKRMNIELGANIKYWEVGNECYGPWEHGFDVDGLGKLTGDEYGEDFNIFAKAMKAVDPTIKVGAVLTKSNESAGGDVVSDAEIWNKGVISQVKNSADFFILHEYFTTASAATVDNLNKATSLIADDMNNTKSQIEQYTQKSASDYPVIMTEFNSRGALNTSMYNAVFVSQIIGEQIKAGYGLSSIWASEWKWTEQDCKSLFAVGDPHQKDYTARPSYLPYYYLARCFGDRMVSAISSNNNIRAYASTFDGSDIGVMITNTSSSAIDINLKFGNSNSNFVADWYYCYSDGINVDQENYKKFYVNGMTSTTIGGGPELDNVIPYKSYINENTIINIKPYSVIYMVLRSNPTGNPEISIDDSFDKKGVISIKGKNLIICDVDNVSDLMMTDMRGLKLFSAKKPAKNIDLSELDKGCYIVTCNYGGEKINEKIMLQ